MIEYIKTLVDLLEKHSFGKYVVSNSKYIALPPTLNLVLVQLAMPTWLKYMGMISGVL